MTTPTDGQGTVRIVVSEPGSEVGWRQGHFELRRGGRTARKVRAADARELLLVGRASLSAAALHEALRRGLDVSWVGRDGRFRGCLSPGSGRRPELLLAQARCAGEEERAARLAAGFVAGKVENQRRLLMRAQARWRCPEVAAALAEMRGLKARALDGAAADRLRGLEGRAAALYWRHFRRLIEPSGMRFTGRRFRPPPDPVNAALSFGYALLTSACDSALRQVGLEPGIGYLHETARGRPSLALDLMEEFRPVLVDRVVVRLLNRAQLSPTDFEAPAEERRRVEAEAAAWTVGGDEPAPVQAVHLAPRGRKVLIAELQARFREAVLYPPLGTRQSLREVILLQARHLARVVLGEDERYLAFTPR